MGKQNRTTTKFDDIEFVVIGYNDLLKNKYKSTRTKDLLDAEELRKIEEILNKKKKNK